MARDTAVERLCSEQEPQRTRHRPKGIVGSPRNGLPSTCAGAEKGNVALNDLLRVLWQRKLIIIAIVAVVIAAAFAATKLDRKSVV